MKFVLTIFLTAGVIVQAFFYLSGSLTNKRIEIKSLVVGKDCKK